jgi:phosphoribosyl 1,2-cyclic phosphodiesterase
MIRANGNRACLEIVFLGTRGGIVARSRRHRSHSALLVSCRQRRVMIDCGGDWAGRLGRIRPDAIVLTHAHPDHVDGLRGGAPCPVYATRAAWHGIGRVRIAPRARRLLVPGRPQRIAGVAFTAFRVEHSLLAPAIGLRIGGGRTALVYVPDVVSIPARRRALRGLALYVGDGASITRGVLRGRGARRIGHASIRSQLAWCADARVPRAVFTHCGSEIVRGEERSALRRVRRLGCDLGVEATIARDGLRIDLALLARPAARATGRSAPSPRHLARR